MDEPNQSFALTKTIKLGVGALVVLALAAITAGTVWYSQRNALPTCGSADAAGLVVKMATEALTKEVSSQGATIMNRSIKLSLDMIEKGELSADGHVRKCSAQLVASLTPEMTAFLTRTGGNLDFAGVRKESADRFSVPINYELKALDSASSPWAASVPSSTALTAFQGSVAWLAMDFEPSQPSGQPDSSVKPASAPESGATISLDTDTVARFSGEWTAESHASSAIVGGIKVVLDGNPRIQFASGGVLDVSPTTFGGQVLLFRVKTPQRLPETQPASVDPEPVYWIALSRAAEADNPASVALDMAVFLKPDRPAMDITLERMCPEAGREPVCRRFDFAREGTR